MLFAAAIGADPDADLDYLDLSRGPLVMPTFLSARSARASQDIDGHPFSSFDPASLFLLGCDISTYCIGQASSGAAILLAAGSKGKRYGLPNARVMLHQPYGGITGQAEDIRIQAEEVIRDKKNLAGILAKHTGQDAAKIIEETERDRYMNVEEAKEYGIIDEVLDEPKENSK